MYKYIISKGEITMFGTMRQIYSAGIIKSNVIGAIKDPEITKLYQTIEDAAWWLENFKQVSKSLETEVWYLDTTDEKKNFLIKLAKEAKPSDGKWSIDLSEYPRALQYFTIAHVKCEKDLIKAINTGYTFIVKFTYDNFIKYGYAIKDQEKLQSYLSKLDDLGIKGGFEVVLPANFKYSNIENLIAHIDDKLLDIEAKNHFGDSL